MKDGMLWENKAPAIQMNKADHVRTISYGSSPAGKQFRAQQAELIKQGRWREAQQMDIDDIRSMFGDKYDHAILEMLEYSDSLTGP